MDCCSNRRSSNWKQSAGIFQKTQKLKIGWVTFKPDLVVNKIGLEGCLGKNLDVLYVGRSFRENLAKFIGVQQMKK